MNETEIIEEPTRALSNVLSFEEQKIKLKEMLESGVSSIDLSEFCDDVKLSEMNEKHAFINSVGSRPMVMCWVYSPLTKKKTIEFRAPESIVMQYCNQSVKIGTSFIDLGKWWIRHSERREYETVVFAPGEPKEFNNCYNTYEGMATEPTKGYWKHTLAHIYHILCNKDANKFRYVIKWFAWCLQNPGKRAEIALIFKGKQGAGKGFIFSQFVEIFGDHGAHISNREHLTGTFNGYLERTIFLFADEAYYPGDKEVEGALNQLISEEKLAIRAMRRDVIISRNCLHIGMATNAEWVIPATDDVRRYFINEVDNKYAKGESPDATRENYFNKVWSEMANGGREAMAYDLLHMDLEKWHPRSDVPKTQELAKQKSISLPKIFQALAYMLEDGRFPGEMLDIDEYLTSFKSLNDHFISLNPSNSRFNSRNIIDAFKKLELKKVHKANGNHWEFPSLKECKYKFNKNISKSYKFDSVEEEWVVLNPGY